MALKRKADSADANEQFLYSFFCESKIELNAVNEDEEDNLYVDCDDIDQINDLIEGFGYSNVEESEFLYRSMDSAKTAARAAFLTKMRDIYEKNQYTFTDDEYCAVGEQKAPKNLLRTDKIACISFLMGAVESQIDSYYSEVDGASTFKRDWEFPYSDPKEYNGIVMGFFQAYVTVSIRRRAVLN